MRDYLAEALSVLAGESLMLTEKAHLEALQEHYRLILEDTKDRIRETMEMLEEFN